MVPQDIRQEIENTFETFKSYVDGKIEAVSQRMDKHQITAARPDHGAPGDVKTKELNEAWRAFMKGDQHAFVNKAMSVGSDPSGGYMVMPQMESRVTEILRDLSPFRRLASVKTLTSGDSYEEVYTREVATATWVTETGSRDETAAPDLHKFMVPLHEIYSMPSLTQKLIDSSDFDFVSWLSASIGKSFGESEGGAFVTGNGTSRPRGITSYPTAATADATRAWGTIEHVVSGAAAGFATPSVSVSPADCLIDLVGSLKAGYRPRAVWQMNRTTAAIVRKFKDADGRFIWQDSLQLGQPAVLLGHAVHLNEDMPAVGADALPIAFGDFSEYYIADGPGFRLLLDPFTNKPNVRVYVYRRVGGGVRDFNAIKLLKIGT